MSIFVISISTGPNIPPMLSFAYILILSVFSVYIFDGLVVQDVPLSKEYSVSSVPSVVGTIVSVTSSFVQFVGFPSTSIAPLVIVTSNELVYIYGYSVDICIVIFSFSGISSVLILLNFIPSVSEFLTPPSSTNGIEFSVASTSFIEKL